MHNRIDIGKMIGTKIVLRALAADGHELWRQTTHNQATNAFATMLMTAWLRSGASQIAYLYARFGDNGSNLGVVSPTGGDMAKTTRANFLATPGDSLILGGLWVPLLAAPAQTSTDVALYTGNQCTYYFRIPASIPATQISPAANFAVETSYIATLGLATTPSQADRTQDSIVTVTSDFTPFLIPAGGQMAIDYACDFHL